MVKKIPLTQNKYALVDDEDFDFLNQWKWFYNCGYACRSQRVGGKTRETKMHRIIMNTPVGMQTDHRDCDSLNNVRSNLRICTKDQNRRNVKKQKNNTSGFKGASWDAKAKKWRSYIRINKLLIYLGYFTTAEAAHNEYKKAAIKYHGEFARFD